MILNFAKLLRKVVPLRYFVDRFGGDEFIVIAEDISGRLFVGHALFAGKKIICAKRSLQTT